MKRKKKKPEQIQKLTFAEKIYEKTEARVLCLIYDTNKKEEGEKSVRISNITRLIEMATNSLESAFAHPSVGLKTFLRSKTDPSRWGRCGTSLTDAMKRARSASSEKAYILRSFQSLDESFELIIYRRKILLAIRKDGDFPFLELIPEKDLGEIHNPLLIEYLSLLTNAPNLTICVVQEESMAKERRQKK